MPELIKDSPPDPKPPSEISGVSTDSDNGSDAGILSFSSSSSKYASSSTLSATDESWAVIEDTKSIEGVPAINGKAEGNEKINTSTSGDCKTLESSFDPGADSDDSLIKNSMHDSTSTYKVNNTPIAVASIKTVISDSDLSEDDNPKGEKNEGFWETLKLESDVITKYVKDLELKFRQSRFYMMRGKILLFMIVLIAASTVLKVSTKQINTYLWKRDITNKSIAPSKIPHEKEYLDLYKQVCEKSSKLAYQELDECLSHGNSKNTITSCYSQYREKLAKDSAFCSFHPNQRLAKALIQHTGMHMSQLGNNAKQASTHVWKEFIRLESKVECDITTWFQYGTEELNKFWKKDVPAYEKQLKDQANQAWNTVSKVSHDASKEAFYLVSQAWDWYKSARIESNKMYKDFKKKAGFFYKNYALPQLKSVEVSTKKFYQKTIIPRWKQFVPLVKKQYQYMTTTPLKVQVNRTKKVICKQYESFISYLKHKIENLTDEEDSLGGIDVVVL